MNMHTTARTLEEFKQQTLLAIEDAFHRTACEDCKDQQSFIEPGIHNFYAFLQYVLDKPTTCCVYACHFIQRMIEFPLYSTNWRQYNYLPYQHYCECDVNSVPVDVLFVNGRLATSPVLVRFKEVGTIHLVIQGHLEDQRFVKKK